MESIIKRQFLGYLEEQQHLRHGFGSGRSVDDLTMLVHRSAETIESKGWLIAVSLHVVKSTTALRLGPSFYTLQGIGWITSRVLSSQRWSISISNSVSRSHPKCPSSASSRIVADPAIPGQLEPLALCRDVAYLCMLYCVYDVKCFEELFNLFHTAEYCQRSARRQHQHHLDGWRSTTVLFVRNFLSRTVKLENELPSAMFSI
ncbi:hypothetical protein EVAR_307_1 [Eumeta japonica]|uniref:Uncharacterized protein n=1 Tax=Eumeta variegata TaxID=151549 RepID=A0A4C1SCT3_EUMVA|nr:hypothetical protein EVAR_307_1 [Eumeta japonica]